MFERPDILPPKMKWYFVPFSTIIILVATLIFKIAQDLACGLTNGENWRTCEIYTKLESYNNFHHQCFQQIYMLIILFQCFGCSWCQWSNDVDRSYFYDDSEPFTRTTAGKVSCFENNREFASYTLYVTAT